MEYPYIKFIYWDQDFMKVDEKKVEFDPYEPEEVRTMLEEMIQYLRNYMDDDTITRILVSIIRGI